MSDLCSVRYAVLLFVVLGVSRYCSYLLISVSLFRVFLVLFSAETLCKVGILLGMNSDN